MRAREEEDRTPVGRPDFKSGEGRTTSLVGSTPTLFRQTWAKPESKRDGRQVAIFLIASPGRRLPVVEAINAAIAVGKSVPLAAHDIDDRSSGVYLVRRLNHLLHLLRIKLIEYFAPRGIMHMGIGLMAVLLTLTASNATALDAARTMTASVWEKRVLLTFAPNRRHAEFRQQAALLGAVDAGLAERDMTLIRVFADGEVVIEGNAHPDSASSFYRRFSVVKDEFRVILVGKDGTVKLDRAHAVTAGDLFALIDAMPMRRLEMQRDE